MSLITLLCVCLASYNTRPTSITKHIVTLHAKAARGSFNKYFPAIVFESDGKESILVSAAWGAEPFPVPPQPLPIESITLIDSGEAVKVVAFDTKLGVGIFSVQKALPPLPQQ